MTSKLTYSIFNLFIAAVLATPANALELCGKPAQGEILLGRADNLASAKFHQQELRIGQGGWFLLAFGRDETSGEPLLLTDKDGETMRYDLEINPTAWDIQKLKGVPPRKVTPADSDLRDIETETKLVRAAQAGNSDVPYWKKGFIKPLQGRTSGNFGGQRIMNGIKKNPHGGMDIAVPEGTPVAASSDGIVTLAAPGLFYSGNVVIIDHGYGLHTIYAHLSEIKVNRGEIVKQGQIIATSGKTGRVTGPHLHWGASLNGTRFNPPSLLNLSKSSEFCFTL